MAAAESSAGKVVKEVGAVAVQRAARTEVVCTARDHWGDQYVSVRHRGCTVHWGPESSERYLEVVLDAVTRVAAGTTVEATADRIRAHVADAIGEERLELETATEATNKSGDEELGEEAAAERYGLTISQRITKWQNRQQQLRKQQGT